MRPYLPTVGSAKASFTRSLAILFAAKSCLLRLPRRMLHVDLLASSQWIDASDSARPVARAACSSTRGRSGTGAGCLYRLRAEQLRDTSVAADNRNGHLYRSSDARKFERRCRRLE